MTIERDFDGERSALARAADLRETAVALDRLQREMQDALNGLQARLDVLETRLNQLRNEGSV